jgi:hypothetical protein
VNFEEYDNNNNGDGDGGMSMIDNSENLDD